MMDLALNVFPMTAAMGIFWIAVIALIIWILKDSPTLAQEADRRALDIIDQRYARGEVDES